MEEDMAYSAQRTVLTLLIVCLLNFSLLFACKNKTKDNVLPYYNTPDFSPVFLTDKNNLKVKVSHKIENFSFIDQNNNPVTQKNIEGKIHVADFFFTSCGSICPVMTRHMKMIDSAYKKNNDIVLLSYSVTPWIDSVSILKEYAKKNNISNVNWHLLTGKKSSIYTLARKSYFAEEDLGFSKDSTNFLHTEHFLLVDRNKRIRGIYNGTLQLEIEQLIKDINTLLKE